MCNSTLVSAPLNPSIPTAEHSGGATHNLLALLQGELSYMHQVQRPQKNGEMLTDKSDPLTGIWQRNRSILLYLITQPFN